MKLSALSFALICLAAFSAAHAQDRGVELEVSYFQPDIELDASVNASISDGSTVSFGQTRGDVDAGTDGWQLSGTWRPTERQSLIASWYRTNADRRFSTVQSGSFNDGADTYDYDLDGSMNIDGSFELYSLSYGFDVLRTDNASLTALAGVYGARLRTDWTSAGTLVVNEQEFDLADSAYTDDRRYAPGLGLASQWRINDKWDVRASAQGFRTQWGNFTSTDGHFLQAQAKVGYNATDAVNIFAGYDWFELDLREREPVASTVDGVAYTGSVEGRGRLRVHGPAIGVRVSF